MASQVISFRLSDAEVEVLEAQKTEGEKPSQTAQRLLRGILGLPSAIEFGAIATNTAENIPGLEAFVVRILEQQLGEREKLLGESVA